LETQLLGFDEKRLRIVHIMSNASSGDILATGEHMLLHVDSEAGRACPFENILYEKLEKIWQGHQNLKAPVFAGKGILRLT
jgi:carnitine 3-dehydrogenase